MLPAGRLSGIAHVEAEEQKDTQGSLVMAVKTQEDIMVNMSQLESHEFGSAEVQTANQGTLPQASSSRVNNEPKPIICFKCEKATTTGDAPDAACRETGDPR